MYGLRRGQVAAAGAVLLMGLTASCGDSAEAGDDGDEGGTSGVLQKAYDECSEELVGAIEEAELEDTTPTDFMEISDGGETLTLSNSIEGTFGVLMSTASAQCVLNETDAPSSVAAEMSQTSAIMGRQTADWDDLEVSYSFDADTGISAVFTTS